MICLFFALLASMASLASSFVISEIYSNDKGRGRDQGKEWLELINISGEEIAVNKVRLTIMHNGSTIFSEEKILVEHLPFSYVMLIAQEKNLGFKECLATPFVVTIKDFSLPNSGDVKICVELNDSLISCTILSKKQKRPDGKAVFRDPTENSESPLFMPEPCSLIDGIFATPGLPARACITHGDLVDIVFSRCKENESGNFSLSHFVIEPNSQLTIDMTLLPYGDEYDLLLNQGTEDLPYIVTTCSAPRETTKICHVIEQKVVNKKSSTRILRPTTDTENNHHYCLVQDVHGATKKTTMPPLPKTMVQTNEAITVKAIWQPTMLTLEIAIAKDHLPVTLWVATENHEVLYQRAFLQSEAVRFDIDLPMNSVLVHMHLLFAGVKGSGQIALPRGDE